MKKKTKKSLALSVPKVGDLELSIVATPFQTKQLLHILQRTPAGHIYKRPAKGGGEWEYITGAYVKKVLNYVFGWLWSFEVKAHGREGNLIWVLGRLTINDKNGKPMIVKEQFGRADMKMKKGTESPLDYGNDLKAASTDALKKCASELGIGSDVYARNEFRDIQVVDKGFSPPEVYKAVKTQPDAINGVRIGELKGMLAGETDEAKISDLKKRTGIELRSFEITEKHSAVIIASLLNDISCEKKRSVE
jgi:hypothetical protein